MDASGMHWLLIVLFIVGALIALVACGLPRPITALIPAKTGGAGAGRTRAPPTA
jgi:hypothetical protein